MPPLLIHDGYTFSGTLKAVGPWPAVRIRYRPALPEDVLEFLYQRDLVSGKAQIKPIVDFLARHLVGWDIHDAKGDVTPVTADHLRRVPQPLLHQMLDHVMGYAEEAEADGKNSAGASA